MLCPGDLGIKASALHWNYASRLLRASASNTGWPDSAIKYVRSMPLSIWSTWITEARATRVPQRYLEALMSESRTASRPSVTSRFPGIRRSCGRTFDHALTECAFEDEREMSTKGVLDRGER